MSIVSIERIDSSSLKERAEGVADLKHVLRNSGKLQTLSDAAFHQIYEVLFRVALAEQSSYLKAKTTTTRSSSENRISAFASALRLAVEVGVRTVKLKTVKSLFDHIIQTLLVPGGNFCDPLALDYAKCLTALLSYQPHVEHLSQKERDRAALFFVECIEKAEIELAEYDAAPGAEVNATTSTINGLSYRSSRSHFKDSGGSQGGRSLAKQIAEEMVACLALLTAVPNANSGDESDTLLAALIGFLKSSTGAGRSHQDAFAAINHILAWTRTEEIDLTRKSVSPLIRLIRNYWSLKSSPTLKDEMLITWIYLRPYTFSAINRGDALTLRSELSGVYGVMKSEYGRRLERDQLHIEDLRLQFDDTSSSHMHKISTAIFRLRYLGIRAESNWTTAYMLASLCDLLGSHGSDDSRSEDDDDDDISQRPRKRQRLTDEFDEVLRSSADGTIPSKLCALQTLTFLAQQRSFSYKQVTKAIDRLSASCAEENVTISSWAFLALASFASQATSINKTISRRWISVWQLATRAMSNASTCRAASHLVLLMLSLRLVSQQNVSDLVQTMTTSMDLNGPSTFSESVALFLGRAVNVSQQINPASSSATAEAVLSWLFRSLSPSKFEARIYASQHSFFEPGDVVDLIGCCLGQASCGLGTARFPVWDSIGQIWLASQEQQNLLTYLLLLPETTAAVNTELQNVQQTSQSVSQSRAPCEALVLNHMTSEFHAAKESWAHKVRDAPQSISLDAVTFFSSMSCIATCIAFCHSFRDNRRQMQLKKQMREILKSLSTFMASQNCAQDKVDAILSTLSCACTSLLAPAPGSGSSECEKLLCHAMSEGMTSRERNKDFNVPDNDEDAMELDDNYDSQDSIRGNQSTTMLELRNEFAVSLSKPALRSSVAMYSTVVAISNQQNGLAEEKDASSKLIVDYILGISEESFLSSHSITAILSHIGIDMTAKDTYRLLEYCTETILGSYSYNRNEVALGAILDIMASLASTWTTSEDKSLFNIGIDMYEWYTTDALSAGVLSPSVQKRVASLLLQLCQIDTEYGKDNGVPSVRTSLFKLLQLGSLTLQFHLANRISAIFGLFVLSTHSTMFDDLQMNLPADTEWVEGMAMRLLFLSELGSAWHSLLRQCVYYIFETAGRVETSTKHAARSISRLATSLKFRSPQKLFHLFAPQLLHSWLESQTVASLPFGVFQYESLNALIAHNQVEITAQLFMRGNDDGIEFVLNALKLTSTSLVTRGFAKCEAYCICWDVSRHTSSANTDTTESRLRKSVGKDEQKTLIASQFAAIMGQFFLSLQQDDEEDKWLEKRSAYSSASKALGEMKSFSHSDRALPPVQQPSFKSRHLCDQIERLCRRTLHDPVKPWSSPSFALAARMLFDSVDDALGPLHACTVIRRLRLLIAMGGDVAISGFPLEMLIHTLRPFLSNSQCADDVMGILQYLFHHGQEYLKTTLPFLYGTVMLMILQIQKHSRARQESTTQESQHKTTVQRMQSLQAWLVKYLQQCMPSDRAGDYSGYESFAKALARVSLPGNARKGSPESSLLVIVLGQVGVEEGLVTSRDRDEALKLLSENFELPRFTTEDCLEDDKDCVHLAPSLWLALRTSTLSGNFVIWASSVLGRAYASTGNRPLTSLGQDGKLMSSFATHYEGVRRAHATIARRLSNSLFSNNLPEASVADYTLRYITQSFGDAEEALAFEQLLPCAVVPAIVEGTQGYEPASASKNADRETVLSLRRLLEPSPNTPLENWARDLSLLLCHGASDAAILPALPAALQNIDGLALDVLPCIIHVLLVKELAKEPILRTELSSSVTAHIAGFDDALRPKQQFLLNLVLYLRGQAMPGESTTVDRLRWLDVDWLDASQAADRCSMPTAALLFAESATQKSHGSRRASSRASFSQVSLKHISQELLLSIFKTVEEPDSFYGVEQPASLDSVLDRLEYEADGFRSLMFGSAQTDTHLRRAHQLAPSDTMGMIRSLSVLNLNSLTFALLSAGVQTAGSSDELLDSARRLQQWDIVPPELASDTSSNCFKAFQELSRANDRASVQSRLRSIIVAHTKPVATLERGSRSSHEWFSALASLVEMAEVICSPNQAAVGAVWNQMQSRQSWMKMAPFENFRSILSNRHILFSTLVQNKATSASLGATAKDCRRIEIESLLDISRFARQQGQLQEALAATSQVDDLVNQSRDIVLKADAAAKFETASVLWDLGEASASVRMLRDVLAIPDLDRQDITVGRSGLLAQLAHQLAEARLEKPEEILSQCLRPAISQLQSRNEGHEAGEVFHEFATFCDKQLQNPGNTQDFNRITKLRQRKLEEVEELERLSKDARRAGTDKQQYAKDLTKAQQWYAIDDADYQRLKRSRDTFLQQSLQNYLLALRASDEHNLSVLRFFALWLENSDDSRANAIINNYLPGVPSWKFVVLMNQLMSRLEQDSSVFQSSLKALAMRICSEHPHHCLHHLFATTRKPASRDPAALSGYQVGTSMRQQLSKDPKTARLLESVFRANNCYQAVAIDKAEHIKANQIAVRDLPTAYRMLKTVPELAVPPSTISLSLRPNGDYENVPTVAKFLGTMRIMGGISRPKKLTAIASDGRQYVQLLKSGDDDLRQDAIMEQVFEEVSKMLRNHKTTRERNLHIRTYKVVPLGPTSGIIEFVPNSRSFAEFLVSAHERYHPQDYKNNYARGKILEAQDHSTETRMKQYRKVCEHVQPVLRHFFFERFSDPDEWFERRTAYTRTTATISMVGYMLGLGDRHCQNIMLDEKTGEVVHIDLGVAFEAGRVLRVPELVPFRLTRDVVDGMGVTKTEGVFRRCCEFTMDSLREDKDSIMTLLNVLRYDPLYTWTVSPLRAKRMQDETSRNVDDAEAAEGSSKKKEQEAGEADRSLSIVEKKLSQTLSTAATVNELIQQAMDERNLATLFHGWSAWF